MDNGQEEAGKILLQHIERYVAECDNKGIKTGEIAKSIVTLGIYTLIRNLDKSYTLEESLKKAKEGLEIYAEETYSERLKIKLDDQDK